MKSHTKELEQRTKLMREGKKDLIEQEQDDNLHDISSPRPPDRPTAVHTVYMEVVVVWGTKKWT